MYCLSKKRSNTFKTCFFFLLLCVFNVGPTLAFTKNIIFNNLDTESLLPHPYVNSIVQDKEGFIWFATQNGLSRFDGRNMKHYFNQPDDPNSLGNNWIWSLFSDSEGRLWIGSANGIHLYQPEKDGFINFSQKQVQKKSISAIAEDSQGKLWFATHYSGVISYDTKQGDFTLYSKKVDTLQTNELNDVVVDSEDTVWVATANQGIIYKTADSQEFVDYPSPLPSQKLNTLLFDNEQTMWVGSEDAGVFTIKNMQLAKHYRNITSQCSNVVNNILLSHSNELWFATDNGLCQKTQADEFIPHRRSKDKKNTLSGNRIFALMQDSGGVIWVGTTAGVSKWNASLTYFSHLTNVNTQGLKSNSIMAFTTVQDNLFVGSWGEGLSRVLLPEASSDLSGFDARLAEFKNLNVMSLFADSQQNLWIGTYRSGLYLLPRNSEKTIHLTEADQNTELSLSSNSVSTFSELADGSVLVGTYGGGLNNYKFAQGKLINTELNQAFNDSPNKFILDIAVDIDGSIWIASSDVGLLQLSPTAEKQFNLFKDTDSFSQFKSEEVFSISIDVNTIWAATNSGLLEIDKPLAGATRVNYKLINNQQGLTSNFVYGVLKDKLGYIWLSHGKGVSRYTPGSGQLQNFNTTHGLQGVDFNSSAIYQTMNGRLLFGGSNGLNSFLPEQLPINTFKPPLRLTGFKQENNAIPLQSKLSTDGFIELKHDQTVIDFEFVALDYTRPENNHYRYKMIGMSEVWHDLGKNNLVSFSHLPPGFYELNVQGSNNDGVWSDTMKLPIRVLPPIWQTNNAYFVYMLVFLAISALVYKQHKQQRLKRKAHAKHLHRLAYYDTLTGLPNRQNFYESLTNYLVAADKRKAQAWVLLFNLDRFKRINDTLGHEFGDNVLKEVADRVFKFLSKNNFTYQLKGEKFNSNFARLGGDEFTLLINRIANKDEITDIITQLVELLSKPIEIDRYQVTVTPSIGVANYPESGTSVSDLLKHADIALHQAKAEGRRTHKFYTDVLDNKAMERLQIEELMRKAIANEEFELYYQPQVNVKSNKVTKAEALIRWNSPVLGNVSPAEFIPIAEESGLIIELGDWILNKACQQAKAWQLAGISDCKVSVNVSSVQFKQSALLSKIQQALAESELAPELLEIELTESAIMSDLEDNIARLNDLKQMGMSIACDDFGTGYSSLSYLKQFPLDTLKIDRSFIEDVATDENDEAIVKAIMLLADTMQLKVVAEGVETIEQLQVLNRFNCELIQGFFFSKPLKNDDFVRFVTQNFYQDKFMWELELLGKA